MAIRRLNYTGRKKIRREDVSIALHDKPNAPATFDADLSRLSEYRLPDDAVIAVEARLQTRWMRFGYGTVGAIFPAADRALTEFDSTDGIMFSVKVTAVSGNPGKLLAEAEGIPVRFPGAAEEPRNPLLPVKSDDIGHEVYRLDFSNDPPILLVNRAAGDKDAIVRSPLFMSIVYPAALREILNRIIHVDEPRRPGRRRGFLAGPVAQIRGRAALRRPRPAEGGRRPRAVDRRRRGRLREATGHAGTLHHRLAERRPVMPVLRRLNAAGVVRFEQYLAVLRGAASPIRRPTR